jgi:hypothetical protein
MSANVVTIPVEIPLAEEQPTVGILLAGKAVGLGSSATYDAHKAGRLPFPVLECGGKFRVPTAALRRVLQLDEPTAQDHPGAS